MTVSISTQYLRDVNQSIVYFLSNETYIRSGASSYVTNTLKGFFPGLDITLGYVDQLDKLKLPAIALVPPVTVSGGEDMAFGNHVKVENFSYQLFGFMGKQQTHGDNLVERDKLVEDLKALLEDQDYITLMQFDGSDTVDSGGNISIENVSFTFFPPEEEPEASRYRFSLDFDVEYLKEI